MIKAGDTVCLADTVLGCGEATYYDEHARVGVLKDANGQLISFKEEDMAFPPLESSRSLEDRFERKCMSEAMKTEVGYDIIGFGRFAMKAPRKGFMKECVDKKWSELIAKLLLPPDEADELLDKMTRRPDLPTIFER